MTLCNKISAFLNEQSITHDTVTIEGHSVVLAHTKGKSVFIIPVAQTSYTPDKAIGQSLSISGCIDSMTKVYGERPIVVTEDRWIRQESMTKARLLAHLEVFSQIYARNCEVRKIDKDTAAEFLKQNHSYGDASCRYRYGLYLRRHTGHNAEEQRHIGELIAVATFSNARKWIKGEKTIRSYEWTRYASLPDLRISGGMGKLLKAFIAEVKPDDLMTYADLEWSEGKVYEALGFILESIKKPVMFSIDTCSWERTAVRSEEHADVAGQSGNRYFQNFGSNKYRLKLTDYQ